ncbi:MAG: hypothetical protein U0559_01060 [Anaerolineae bacterium]
MKKKYQAMKMYLVGLTAGAFMFGWSLVAQSGNTIANAAQATVSQTASTSTTTVQTATTNRPTVIAQPVFRTRTS